MAVSGPKSQSKSPRPDTTGVEGSNPWMDRRTLVDVHAPYVRGIAAKIKKTVPKEISFEELYDYGIIGLLEAADRFDPSLGAHFTTFAYYRVRGAIYDGLRGMGWMSRSAYAKARFDARANAFLEEAAHPPADLTSHELKGEAQATSISRDERHVLEVAVEELAQAVHGLAAVYLTSLDAASEAQLADVQEPGPEQRVGLEELRRLVRKTILRLEPEERQLLELYYYKDKSMQQVGDDLGLSKSWTSRLHARVIDKLHHMLEEA